MKSDDTILDESLQKGCLPMTQCGGGEGTQVFWRIWRMTFWGLCKNDDPTWLHLFGDYYFERKRPKLTPICARLEPGESVTVTGSINLRDGSMKIEEIK